MKVFVCIINLLWLQIIRESIDHCQITISATSNNKTTKSENCFTFPPKDNNWLFFCFCLLFYFIFYYILFHFISFHFISFHFILFYLISYFIFIVLSLLLLFFVLFVVFVLFCFLFFVLFSGASLFCFLFCFVSLFFYVLFCFVLVWFDLVWFGLVWFGLVRFCFVSVFITRVCCPRCWVVLFVYFVLKHFWNFDFIKPLCMQHIS